MALVDPRTQVDDPIIERRPFVPRRGRSRWIALGVAVAVLVGFGGFYVIGKHATPVTVGQAVQRYRAEKDHAQTASSGASVKAATTGHGAAGPAPLRQSEAVAPTGASGSAPSAKTTAATASGVPAAGVYVYNTNGNEHVSALGGASHTYPAQTTITVAKTACGADIRWDALQERWDEWSTCGDGLAIQVRSIITYHEFFKQVDKKSYNCTPATFFRPTSDRAGTTFSGNCAGSGASITWKGSVKDGETMTIAGRTVRAVHVRIDEVLTGDTHGTRHHDSWYEDGTNLLLRRESYTDVDSKSAFGYTHYNENLSMRIASLAPQR